MILFQLPLLPMALSTLAYMGPFVIVLGIERYVQEPANATTRHSSMQCSYQNSR